jgi:AhpD family alkylhydroperoxidase
MDEKTRELASIAAAIAGKCSPCFAYHCKQARALGIRDELIQEVIQLAKDIGLPAINTWMSLRCDD